MYDIKKLIDDLNALLKSGEFDGYIHDATFPNFKNLSPNTRLSFNFPLTALVGMNGIGKTSLLHAMYGMPQNSSTSQYWFPTALDPMKQGVEEGPNRYFYTHWIKPLKKLVESSKTRVLSASRKDSAVYWEPRKPVLKDGMQRMPEALNNKEKEYTSSSGDRWTAPIRDVLFINQKSELGAFDRYLHFYGDESLGDRQKTILEASSRLSRIIRRGSKTFVLGGRRECVFENRSLTENELEIVNFILDKNYISAVYVFHSLYGKIKAPSVLFESLNLKYSEAFAGSGELSVVTLVTKVLSAAPYSLILLDEPETSLHPKAQTHLLGFLLDQIKTKRLQVVLSTHSPTIISNLPNTAIKVFESDEQGKSRIIENVHHSVAFNRIGHIRHDRITLVAEDQLLKVFLDFSVAQLDPGLQNLFDVKMNSVGADEILSHNIVSWLSTNSNVYVFLDGDQEAKLASLPDTDELTQKQRRNIKKILTDLEFSIAAKYTDDQYFDYIEWVKKRVYTIDAICPEQIFLELLSGENLPVKTNNDYKVALRDFLQSKKYKTDAMSLNTIFNTKLIDQKEIGLKNLYVQSLVCNLIEISQAHHA